MHTDAITLIQEEIDRLGRQMSETGADSLMIKRKDSLKKSMRLLHKLANFEVNPKAVIHELPLPECRGHFSEFRVIDDHETEDKEYWTEVVVDGSPIRAIVGDLLILNSETDKRTSG